MYDSSHDKSQPNFEINLFIENANYIINWNIQWPWGFIQDCADSFVDIFAAVFEKPEIEIF